MSRREVLFGLVLSLAAAAHALDATRGGEGVDFFTTGWCPVSSPPENTPVSTTPTSAAGNVSLVEFVLERGGPDLGLPLLAAVASVVGVGLVMRHGHRDQAPETASPDDGLVGAIAVKPVLQATALYDPVLTMGLMVAGGWIAFGLLLRELLITDAPCGA